LLSCTYDSGQSQQTVTSATSTPSKSPVVERRTGATTTNRTVDKLALAGQARRHLDPATPGIASHVTQRQPPTTSNKPLTPARHQILTSPTQRGSQPTQSRPAADDTSPGVRPPIAPRRPPKPATLTSPQATSRATSSRRAAPLPDDITEDDANLLNQFVPLPAHSIDRTRAGPHCNRR